MINNSIAAPPAIADTINPIINPISIFLGVPPKINVVFKAWEVPPATAVATQAIAPASKAIIIPLLPTTPIAFKIPVINNKVAIVIPDTGLLDAPIIPHILADTTENKNENNTANKAPIGWIPVIGNNQDNRNTNVAPPITQVIGKSLSVLFTSPPEAFIPEKAAFIDLTIIGIDFPRLINPPAATAPAPIYLIYSPLIALAVISAIGTVAGNTALTAPSPKNLINGISPK